MGIVLRGLARARRRSVTTTTFRHLGFRHSPDAISSISSRHIRARLVNQKNGIVFAGEFLKQTTPAKGRGRHVRLRHLQILRKMRSGYIRARRSNDKRKGFSVASSARKKTHFLDCCRGNRRRGRISLPRTDYRMKKVFLVSTDDR
jgi:hypothetical protein